MMVAVFETTKHIEYYGKSGPSHHAVVGGLLPIVEGMQVLDIDAGVARDQRALL
jgi:hypothetical protein